MNQLDCHLDVISRHAHLCSLWKVANTCYVCCSEIELRTIVVEEWCMTATFIFCQNVNLSCEFCMACKCSWFSKNLSTLDLVSLNTTKKCSDVITSLSLIKKFTEHLDTSYNNFTSLLFDTNDLNFLRYVKNTSLNSTSCNCTTSCDGEYVLYRHYERFICVTLWVRNVLINSIHKLHDLVSPWASRILKSFKSRTLDNRNVISWEVILGKKITDLHLNELKKLLIVYHITFVHEYNDVRNTYLTGKKDMLFSLSHNTVCSSNNKDSTMSTLCLILNVSCRNCDTTLSFLWSFIDILKVLYYVSWNSLCKNFSDSCC